MRHSNNLLCGWLVAALLTTTLPCAAVAAVTPAEFADSVLTTGEDTTFLYEGEDSSEYVLEDASEDEFIRQMHEGWDVGGDTLFKLFSSSWGAWIGIALAVAVLLLVFGLLTAPLWILIILLVLVLRARKRHSSSEPR